MAGSRVSATVRTGTGTKHRRLIADGKGRVKLQLKIGPGNPDQQYSAGAIAAGTTVYAAKVFLRGRRAR
jgi:hypothetical protein